MRFLPALAILATSLATAGDPIDVAVDVQSTPGEIEIQPNISTDIEASVEVAEVDPQEIEFSVPVKVRIRPIIRANVSTIRTVDCVPCQTVQTVTPNYSQPMSVGIDVDVPSMPAPPEPQCIGGNCVRRVIGNRLPAPGGTSVNVDVGPRRGLFWRFRR